MSRIEVTYTLSEAEFMHAARALWSYEAIGDTGNIIIAVIASITGLALLLSGQGIGWLLLAIAAFFGILTVARNLLWQRGYRKMTKYTAPIKASFTEAMVETHSAQGDSDLPWSYFKAYAETPDYFFVTSPRRGLSIIPKSAFDNYEDLDQARTHMATNLPRKKMRWT